MNWISLILLIAFIVMLAAAFLLIFRLKDLLDEFKDQVRTDQRFTYQKIDHFMDWIKEDTEKNITDVRRKLQGNIFELKKELMRAQRFVDDNEKGICFNTFKDSEGNFLYEVVRKKISKEKAETTVVENLYHLRLNAEKLTKNEARHIKESWLWVSLKDFERLNKDGSIDD